MKPPATKGNKKENRLGDKIEDKTSGRHTIQHQGGHLKKTLRTPNSTLFEKKCKIRPPATTKQEERQVGRQTGRQEGRQAGRQARRQGIQNLGKADTPSNTGTHVGTMGDNSETRRREGGHAIRHRHACGETVGDNGRQGRNHKKTDIPSQAHMWGDNGRQKGATRRREGGRTIQHRHACVETMGDNGREWETIGSMGDKGRQDLGKADIPSNTGRQGETRPREGEHTIQNVQAHMWGDNGRQKGKTRRREGGRTIQQRHTCGETMGNSG